MTARWIELIIGSVEDKKRWKAYRARVAQLPAAYRITVEGLERYLVYTGGAESDQLVQMSEDLADLFETPAADGTSVRDVVGEDPIEFAEAFKSNYGLGSFLTKEQRRLTEAIQRAEQEPGR